MMKKSIRTRLLGIRNSLSAEEIHSKSRVIARRLFGIPTFRETRTVMFYVSYGSEVDTHQMLKEALRKGLRVAVPLTQRESKRWLSVLIQEPDRDLFPGFKEIPEPDLKRSVELRPTELDLVIVPGVAFDPIGNRLGMGKAYYDDFLKSIRPSAVKIGLAFECQIVEKIPPAYHDVAMDKIITEKRVIDCTLNKPDSKFRSVDQIKKQQYS